MTANRRDWGWAAALGLLAFLAGPHSLRATDGEKIYKSVIHSVVWVVVPMGDDRYAMGSGSLIDAHKKIILTNYHVVMDRPGALIYFPTFEKGRLVTEKQAYLTSGKGIRGKIIKRESKRDLALIQLESIPKDAKALPIARESPDPGQELHSIGNPGASKALWLYTSGTVRQVYKPKPFRNRDRNGDLGFSVDARIVETQSPVNAGDSGGPVVNNRGELVAVVQGHLDDTQARAMSIFIDGSEVRELLAGKYGEVAREAPSSADPSKDVQAASDQTPKKDKPAEEDEAAKNEKDAARKLRLARQLGPDKAREWYQDIIKTWPKTKAAVEAKKLLDKLDDK